MMTSSHSSSNEPVDVDGAEEGGRVAKFVPFQSAVESAFWVRYCRAKLETIQLSEAAIPIHLSYTVNDGGGAGSSRLQCRDHSLVLLPTTTNNNEGANANNSSSTIISNNECVSVTGQLLSFNTKEAFQTADKNKLLRDHFIPQFWSDDDAQVVQSLSSVLLITWADLKQHKVFYWFGFPILAPQNSIRIQTQVDVSETLAAPLAAAVDTMRRQNLAAGVGLSPYFIFRKSKLTTCVPLSREAYESIQKQALDDQDGDDDIVFAFFDPLGHSGDELMMGWPLRNLICYVCNHLSLEAKTVSILSYRPKVLRRIAVTTSETSSSTLEDDAVLVERPTGSGDKCLLLTVNVPLAEEYDGHANWKVVGWELNARGKPGPRSVNLKPLLDPQHLSTQAADLNLKLMKWRMIPNLNVDRLQSTKVLLIGAGTLGCNVARVLLGWGIRNFTIVDNGRVSYSNPVRQSLFTLEDCNADGGSGRPKAMAAADALHTIAADVQSRGISLSVPMPGHPDSEESIRQAVERLDQLVKETDVVFLLTDTRESRWLPTVMAAAHNTVLLNAALGLDSWLVMRHGGGFGGEQSDTNTATTRHGCYFCSDVVAPENSTKNRTLDQQCTVTRPGLALIAGSMAAEVMVSLLHHPAGVQAPAPSSKSSNFSPTVSHDDAANSPLGAIPHQIRGSLVSYTMMTPTVPAFQHCTGCSKSVVDEYLKDKVGVVQKCCQSTSTSYLEDIAGLTEFRAEAAAKMEDMGDWDEDE